MKLKIEIKKAEGTKIVYYLQRGDIRNIISGICGSNLPPDSFLTEMYDDEKEPLFLDGMADGGDFVCSFSSEESKKWIDGQSWILDYDERKNLSEGQVKEETEKAKNAYFAAMDNLRKRSQFDRDREANSAFKSIRELSLIYNQWKLLLDHVTGEEPFKFPDEYRGG